MLPSDWMALRWRREARGACSLCASGSAARVFSPATLVTLPWPCVTVHVPRRCVSLRIKAAQESVDGDPPGCSSLLRDMDDCLMEIEKRLAAWGYGDRCVDIKLERARIKR